MNKCPICGTMPTFHSKKRYTLHVLCCSKCKFGSFVDGEEVVELDSKSQKRFSEDFSGSLYEINWNRKRNIIRTYSFFR